MARLLHLLLALDAHDYLHRSKEPLVKQGFTSFQIGGFGITVIWMFIGFVQ